MQDEPDLATTGLTLGITLGSGGDTVMAGAELGYFLRPYLAIIASAMAIATLGDDDGGVIDFLGVGPRLESHRAFIDVQLGELGSRHQHVPAGVLDLGFEVVKTRQFGLDLHVSLLIGGDSDGVGAVAIAALGLHRYF